MKKLFSYLFILISFFISLEILVRYNFEAFQSLSDKLLFKIAMLEKRASDEIVFIGSSRTQDSIDVPVFSKQTNKSSFSIASTGQNKNRYFYTINEVLKLNFVKTVIIEIHQVNLRKGKLNFPIEKNIKESDPNLNFEEKLQESVNKIFKTVQVRKSFKPKTLFRLLMYLTSNLFNHDIWFRSNTLLQIFSLFNQEEKATNFPLYQSSSIEQMINDDYSSLIELISKTNKKIIFLNPPVGEKSLEKDCAEKYLKIYSAIKFPLLNFACHPTKKELLRDQKHLNPKGRVQFTKFLGNYLKKENLLDAL